MLFKHASNIDKVDKEAISLDESEIECSTRIFIEHILVQYQPFVNVIDLISRPFLLWFTEECYLRLRQLSDNYALNREQAKVFLLKWVYCMAQCLFCNWLAYQYGDGSSKRILRIKKTQRNIDIKYKTLTEIYINLLNEEYQQQYNKNPQQFINIINWIRYILKENNINIYEFLAWNEIIKTQRYMKRNAIVLEGYTNAGKSLLIENILYHCKPEEIPRERDNSSFHLDQLPNASCAIFEEPIITRTDVGTWKLLLKGKIVKTDLKYKDKEGIQKLPIWITTSSLITNNIDSNETIQILQRIKLFKFTKSIHHSDDDSTLNNEIRARCINKAPGFVKPIHFVFSYIDNWTKIQNIIQQEDEKNVINESRINFTDEITEEVKLWQTQLWTINEDKQTTENVPLTKTVSEQERQ